MQPFFRHKWEICGQTETLKASKATDDVTGLKGNDEKTTC
jgi:hypothetical protein